MENLIRQIEAFCEAHGVSERQFGELAMNDGKLVAQIRSGRDLRYSTVQRITDFMVAYRPADAAA